MGTFASVLFEPFHPGDHGCCMTPPSPPSGRQGSPEDPGQDEAGRSGPAPALQGDQQHGGPAASQHRPSVRGGGDAEPPLPGAGVRRRGRPAQPHLQ